MGRYCRFYFGRARAVLDLFLPLILGRLINEGVGLSEFVSEPNIARIYEFAGLMLIIILISIGITIISSYMESKISSSFAVDLRKAVYKKIETFSLREMDHFTTSSLITDQPMISNKYKDSSILCLRLIILQPVLAFGAIIFSIRTQPSLSMILIASVTGIVFFHHHHFRSTRYLSSN
jgi:ATP-binding cassette, subfamily B, multidrug efflux pump